MFVYRHNILYPTVILQLIILINPVSPTSSDIVKVEGLVHNAINVTLNISHLLSDKYDLICSPTVPYISFLDEFSGAESQNLEGNQHRRCYFSDKLCNFLILVPVNPEDTTVSFQLKSNLIGIFKVNCLWIQDNQYHESETEEMVTTLMVVVGRVKVAENLLTTLMMSVGLGLALFIMGMEIDIQQVILVVK